MTLTFCGAARQVTGSMFLLETKEFRILIDCGLSQGEDEKKAGDTFPFSPASIDLVLLTHAHIDHSGRLPQLVKEGRFQRNDICYQGDTGTLFDNASRFCPYTGKRG